MHKIKVVTTEELISDLMNIAKKIDGGDRNFTEEEWEIIHEAVIQKGFNLQFGVGEWE